MGLKAEQRKAEQKLKALLEAEEAAKKDCMEWFGMSPKQADALIRWMDARARRFRYTREARKMLQSIAMDEAGDEVLADHYRYGSGD